MAQRYNQYALKNNIFKLVKYYTILTCLILQMRYGLID